MQVAVNPIACEAHGMCAELLPERITLDDWGYPLIDERPLSAREIEHARRAAEACPTFALLLRTRGGPEEHTAPPRSGRVERTPSRQPGHAGAAGADRRRRRQARRARVTG